MPIRVNTNDLLEILGKTPRNQNILVVGRHGIGKSEIIVEHYTRSGMRVVPLFLGQMSDPGDLIGLPTKDEISGHTVFMPPFWWPLENEPVVLFLDELNRARPEILQSVHDLALNRSLAGRRLPEGSVVTSAINAGEEYQVTDLDPALASRFNIYELAPEVDEWTAWARGRGIDRRVVDFIERHNSFLDAAGPSDPLDKTPDRRAWVRVGELIGAQEELTPALTKAVAGVVGAQAALAFSRFLDHKERVSAEQLLFELDVRLLKKLSAMTLQELVYLNRQALWAIQQRSGELTARMNKKIVTNVERYIAHLRQTGMTEVLADLINQTDKPELGRASALLLSSPTVMQAMTDYIEKVKL